MIQIFLIMTMIDYDTQEELARKRQLPVPPMPRKGGVIARSEDNVSGADHHH